MTIIAYIAKRLLALLPVACGVVVLVAMLAHFVPGDPVDAISGEYASAEQKAELRKQLNLDLRLDQQLLIYFSNLSKADLGHSLQSNRPVWQLIAERMQATAELALLAMIVAISIGVPLGVIAAIRAGSFLDYLAMGIALMGIATPNFWLASMLILIFSLHFDLLPVSERGAWQSYILPSLTMGTALAAILSRMTRNSMLEILREDFIRTARAKGLSETIVVMKHALRNAALPLVTVIGLQFGVILTGAVITEVVFDWPGLGTLLLDAVRNRDYPVIQGCVLVFSMTYLIVNLCTDIVYAVVDPRIKLS